MYFQPNKNQVEVNQSKINDVMLLYIPVITLLSILSQSCLKISTCYVILIPCNTCEIKYTIVITKYNWTRSMTSTYTKLNWWCLLMHLLWKIVMISFYNISGRMMHKSFMQILSLQKSLITQQVWKVLENFLVQLMMPHPLTFKSSEWSFQPVAQSETNWKLKWLLQGLHPGVFLTGGASLGNGLTDWWGSCMS